MATFSYLTLAETAYQMHQSFILFVQITVSSSSSVSCLCLISSTHSYFVVVVVVVVVVVIDTSATSAFVSVCNSEKIGDYPAYDSEPQFC